MAAPRVQTHPLLLILLHLILRRAQYSDHGRTLGRLVAETERRRDADDSTAFLTLTPPVCPSPCCLSIRQTG